jgi:lysine 2,3-aminomutase
MPQADRVTTTARRSRDMETTTMSKAVTTSTPDVAAKRGRLRYYPDVPDAEWNDWHWQFRNRVTSLEELARFLRIPDAEWAVRQEVLRDFRMGITPYYLSLIDADDPHDALLRQVVPLVEEHENRAIGNEDPLGEEAYSPVPGITHRYPDRVLMVISNSCAIYCRYCTRKRTMYEDAVPNIEIDRMVDYIARTPAVRDVVVSGGDPLTYGTRKLESILSRLREIPHLEIIRIGSRVPVSLPQRIDDELCEMLSKYHPLWINVHYNHPNECSPDAAKACDKLLRAGIPLNNQSVLLAGVNDSVEIQKALVHALMRMRVRPYYLYQCDPVRGADHFRTPISKGIEIMEGLVGHTSGLALPRFVIDAPGGGGKIPVLPQYLQEYDKDTGRALLRNYKGDLYEYFEQEPHLTRVYHGREELERHYANPEAASPVSDEGRGGPVVGKSSWVHRGGKKVSDHPSAVRAKARAAEAEAAADGEGDPAPEPMAAAAGGVRGGARARGQRARPARPRKV